MMEPIDEVISWSVIGLFALALSFGVLGLVFPDANVRLWDTDINVFIVTSFAVGIGTLLSALWALTIGPRREE